MPGRFPKPLRGVPVKVQTGAVGTTNPAASTGRNVPLPSVQTKRPALSRERFKDAALNRLQDKVNAATRQSRALPYGDGQLVQGVAFGAGAQVSIKHSLQAPYGGYHVLNVMGGYGAFQAIPGAAGTATDPSAVIVLQAQNACTADVWVYR